MNGQQFKARREQLGLSRQAFCRLVGFDYRTVSGWESRTAPRGAPPEWLERQMAFWLCDRRAFEAFKAFEEMKGEIARRVAKALCNHPVTASDCRGGYVFVADFRGL